MSDYTSFRERLDHVLRTLDVRQVQHFLIEQGQWQPGTPADPEAAMWLMIAGSATLGDLHGKAREWLMSHGHETEAQALLARERTQGAGKGKGGQPGRKPQTNRQGNRQHTKDGKSGKGQRAEHRP